MISTNLQISGKVVMRFALAYGFRNIQTILRKVKQGLSQYDYIEVMACPSGCINGGGQIPPAKGESLQDHIQSVDQAYHHPQVRRHSTLYEDHANLHAKMSSKSFASISCFNGQASLL